MSNKKTRAIPGPDAGSKRQKLYSAAFGRIDEAIKSGFFLEAICLVESIITDRMEARVAWLTKQSVRHFENLGPLLNWLRVGNKNGKKGGQIKPGLPEIDKQALQIYEHIDSWRKKRNVAVHQMAKLDEDVQATWEERYTNLNVVATEGHKISRKLSDRIKSLNRANKKQKK